VIVELHDRRQAQEVYTIRQVAEMTGVPDNTIRSWERRFGIPRPDRSGSNQRRYRQRDIDMIRSIQAARERGRTMEQAIQEISAAESVSLDRATPTAAPPVTEPPVPVAARPIDPGIDGLVGALEEFDGAGAERLLSDMVWATSIEEACVALLLPAADAIAVGAAAGHIPPAGARFAKGWIHVKLVAALDQSRSRAAGAPVIIAAMHDESAEHDSLCLAIVLSRAGYRVTWLGASVPATEIDEVVDRLLPAAVVLAARSPLSIAAATGSVRRLGDRRDTGAWDGVTAVTGIDDAAAMAAVILPIDARQTVSTLETALRSRESSLRLVRKP